MVFLFVVSLAFYFADRAKESEAIREFVFEYGYLGSFVVAVVSGFNLAVPLPAVAFLPLFLESGLSFWGTIASITAGVTLADTMALLIGRMGREMVPDRKKERMLKRIERLRDRYYWAPPAVLLLYAVLAPFPNELLLVPMGFLGYRAIHIIPLLLIGNFFFNILYAVGIVSVF